LSGVKVNVAGEREALLFELVRGIVTGAEGAEVNTAV